MSVFRAVITVGMGACSVFADFCVEFLRICLDREVDGEPYCKVYGYEHYAEYKQCYRLKGNPGVDCIGYGVNSEQSGKMAAERLCR